jgi:hypothetical protein
MSTGEFVVFLNNDIEVSDSGGDNKANANLFRGGAGGTTRVSRQNLKQSAKN